MLCKVVRSFGHPKVYVIIHFSFRSGILQIVARVKILIEISFNFSSSFTTNLSLSHTENV